MSDQKQFTRRDFMAFTTWGIAGFIGLGWGIPAIAYVIGPTQKSNQNQDWIRLGSTSKVELNTPTLFKTTIKQQ